MIVEYGHVYVQDMIDGISHEDSVRMQIQLTSPYRKAGAVGVVLIDDKEFSLTDDEKKRFCSQVIGSYSSWGWRPEEVCFEKQFAGAAAKFVANLPTESIKWETFRKQGKRVLFLVVGNRKIPLVTECGQSISYSCQLLSSMWRQHKVGVMAAKYKTRRMITVLDRKYETVESDVSMISRDFMGDTNGNHLYLWV